MLPFSDIPYGPAPVYAYPLFEGLMYLLFVLCLLHAWKKGAAQVSYLIGGLLFGLLLEYVNVVANMGYVYGRFTIMFGTAPKDIPLCIGVGWGIIMYTARLYTDALGLKLWPSVALDTLLAISIDLSMDTVAYRMHMWHWNWAGTGLNPLTADWFGIPYGNFFGWVCVVFLYSSSSRLLEKRLITNNQSTPFKQMLVPLFSVLISQVFLFVTLKYVNAFLKIQFGITSKHRFAAALILLSLTVLYGFRNRKIENYTLPNITWYVPAFGHIYFLIFLFIGGFYKENIWMLIVPVVLAIITITIHGLPLLQNKKAARETLIEV